MDVPAGSAPPELAIPSIPRQQWHMGFRVSAVPQDSWRFDFDRRAINARRFASVFRYENGGLGRELEREPSLNYPRGVLIQTYRRTVSGDLFPSLMKDGSQAKG